MRVYNDPTIIAQEPAEPVQKRGRGAPKKYRMTCLECGTQYIGASHRKLGHCSEKCKTAFTNRRSSRGRQLYDMIMTLRYDRTRATEDGVWAAMCRLAAQWREEDTRAGRDRTWADVERLFVEMPFIKPVPMLHSRIYQPPKRELGKVIAGPPLKE